MRRHTLTSVEQGWTNHGQRCRNCHWISHWAPNNFGPSVWDLLYVTTLMFRIFRWFLHFRKICARLMWGSGSISPLVHNINIRWSCQLFTPHRRLLLIPRGCSTWFPFSRRQGWLHIPSGCFGEWKKFCTWQGIETCRFKCRLHEDCAFQSHSKPVLQVGYSTVQTLSNIKVTYTLKRRALHVYRLRCICGTWLADGRHNTCT